MSDNSPRFGLIGHPISHSLSPRLFSSAYAGRWQYDLIETPVFEEAFARFVKDYQAINITAPFKADAAASADIKSPEVEAIGAANILVKRPEGITAFNSDYLGVKKMLSELKGCSSCAVIGYGGAGKAAAEAARSEGLETRVYRHSEITGGVDADIIIFTLPRAAEGSDRLRCRFLIEANYKDPCLAGMEFTAPDGTPGTYIPGQKWLQAQAETGYEIMTGYKPDHEISF